MNTDTSTTSGNTAPAEVAKPSSRAERRARPPRPNVRQQRFAALMRHLVNTKAVEMDDDETPAEFLRRLRREVARRQHRDRKARRTRTRAGRKANR